MGFVWLVLVCIGGGVIVGLLGFLFHTVQDNSPKIEAHFAKHKRRYMTIIGVAVLIAAAVYMANTTHEDQGIVQYDNRGNPIDDN